jgi:hypothetical protein
MNKTHCPGRRLDTFVERRIPLADRVRLVAAEVAQICTAMDDSTLADCFWQMFGLPSDCQMFRVFRSVYRSSDMQNRGAAVDVLGRVHAVAALLEGTAR